MSDHETMLAAVLADPDDDGPRLAYADWLDQQTATPPDPRAEFIRAQINLERARIHGFDAPDTEGRIQQRLDAMDSSDRVAELRARHEAEWAKPVATLVDRYAFHRGFIADVSMSAERFLAGAVKLFDLAPVVHFELTDAAARLERLCASPSLARVRALSLTYQGIDDSGVRFLCESPYLDSLWWLDLGANQVGRTGAEQLAAASNLRNVFFLSLAKNPFDPTVTLGVEGQAIQDASLPQEGRDLEARFGHIPWLHCHADSILEFPPRPLGPPQRP